MRRFFAEIYFTVLRGSKSKCGRVSRATAHTGIVPLTTPQAYLGKRRVDSAEIYFTVPRGSKSKCGRASRATAYFAKQSSGKPLRGLCPSLSFPKDRFDFELKRKEKHRSLRSKFCNSYLDCFRQHCCTQHYQGADKGPHQHPPHLGQLFRIT